MKKKTTEKEKVKKIAKELKLLFESTPKKKVFTKVVSTFTMLLLVLVSYSQTCGNEKKVKSIEHQYVADDFKTLKSAEKKLIKKWCEGNDVVYPHYLDSTLTNKSKTDIHQWAITAIQGKKNKTSKNINFGGRINGSRSYYGGGYSPNPFQMHYLNMQILNYRLR
jgi:hypothetical protein